MFKNKLIDESIWNNYLLDRLKKDFISNKEKEELQDFVTNKKYQEITNLIYNNNYTFSIPTKHLINKKYNSKKRIVYTYKDSEMQILKYISYLLYDYDYLFSKNLYSFRKNIGVKNAIKSLLVTKNIHNMYGYKLDIKNYFNSVNTDILLNNLKKDIIDKDLYNLLYSLLNNKKVIFNNKEINEDKGVIAGSPISSFLANYYLKEIDEYFWNEKVFYIRYADDIIMFTNNKEDLFKYKDILNNYLTKYKLSINSDKEYFYNPGDSFEFLGFSFNGKTVDISNNSLYKMKGKIKRSTRSFRRWMKKKDIKYETVLKTINNKFNKKFYGMDNSELSWKYWFFPTINTTKSLLLIDNYFQQELRFMITGKHNKRNYKLVPYSLLKDCNYKPLVHEYYKLKFNMKDKM